MTRTTDAPPAEDLCRTIYSDTAAFYRKLAPGMGDAALGYKILYGPPIVNPPVLFIGFQPGGKAEDAKQGEAIGERSKWPERLEYSVADWRLARNVRKIWEVPALDRCVGLNAIFFRAPDVKTWKKLSIAMEAKIFCGSRVDAIVSALNPERIVVIGFETFDMLSDKSATVPELTSAKGRQLISRGLLWGKPIYVTIHLSAQISNDDFSMMREYFATLPTQPITVTLA